MSTPTLSTGNLMSIIEVIAKRLLEHPTSSQNPFAPLDQKLTTTSSSPLSSQAIFESLSNVDQFQFFQYLLVRAIHYARTQGLIMYSYPASNPATQLKDPMEPPIKRMLADSLLSIPKAAPFSLLPAPYPREAFELAVRLQPIVQLLMMRAASSREFLLHALKDVFPVDDFIRRIWEIYEEVSKEGNKQPLSFALIRTDYMSEPDNSDAASALLTNSNTHTRARYAPRMVEVNLFSCSFTALPSKVFDMHKMLLRGLNLPAVTAQLKDCSKAKHIEGISVEDLGDLGGFGPLRVPDNSQLAAKLGSGIAQAWRHFGDESAVVVFVVQEREANEADQRGLEWAIYEAEPRCQVRRYTLGEIGSIASIDPHTHNLIIENAVVAFVYYRDGYSPSAYTSEKHWQARKLIEHSRAIKCPTAAVQLANTKRVQQALYEDAAEWLPRLLPPHILALLENTSIQSSSLSLPPKTETAAVEAKYEAIIRELLSTFMVQVTPTPGEFNSERALLHPEEYVLKPQREGGGNNLHGEDLCSKLAYLLGRTPSLHTANSHESSSAQAQVHERAEYVLMRRIKPFEFAASLVRPILPSLPFAPVTPRAGTEAVAEADSERRSLEEAAHGWLRPVAACNELGIFGCILVRHDAPGQGPNTSVTHNMDPVSTFQVLANEPAGYLLRTKSIETKEGGVATGYAFLDSLALVD